MSNTRGKLTQKTKTIQLIRERLGLAVEPKYITIQWLKKSTFNKKIVVLALTIKYISFHYDMKLILL